jgi:hypothetical protein
VSVLLIGDVVSLDENHTVAVYFNRPNSPTLWDMARRRSPGS